MTTRFAPALLLAAGAVTAACGGDDSSAKPSPDASPAPMIDAAAPMIDSGVNLRQQSIELAGAANGVYWDSTASTLYLTDGDNNAFLSYTDAGGFKTIATLPTEPTAANPGGIARLSATSFVTPDFGMGTAVANTLFTIDTSAKTSAATTGLDDTRHRIGIGVSSGGTIYDTYFTGGGGNPAGMVATIAIDQGVATETDLTFATAPTFKKLVGMIVTDDAVYVSDQTQSMLFKITLPGNTVSVVGTVPSADLMTLMPNGDLITGGTGVHRLTQAGVESDLFTTETFGAVHGSAYDASLKRLFFINHSSTAGTKDRLEIRPLDN